MAMDIAEFETKAVYFNHANNCKTNDQTDLEQAEQKQQQNHRREHAPNPTFQPGTLLGRWVDIEIDRSAFRSPPHGRTPKGGDVYKTPLSHLEF